MCRMIELYRLAEKPPMSLVETKTLLPLLSSDESALDFLYEGNGIGTKAQKYLEQLQEAVNYCPACTLAAIRQSPPNSVAQCLTFDYKTAAKAFWEDINNETRVE